MTKRESFEAILAVLNNAHDLPNSADLIAFVEKEIDALTRKSLRANEKAAEKRGQGNELKERIFKVLDGVGKTRQEILKGLNDEEVKLGQVQYQLTQLFKEERINKGQIKIDDSKVMAYWVKNADKNTVEVATEPDETEDDFEEEDF